MVLETPFGEITAPNITPDDTPASGAGRRNSRARCMRGEGGTAAYLYPAFPYPYFTKVTREDTDAIYDYLRTLAPVSNAVNRKTLPFPFSVRAAMMGWNSLFFKSSRFAPDPQRSAEFNRGAYLVEGLGHCGACHTPLNAFGANKASQFLQGNRIDDWTAPNITNDAQSGLGKWSVEEIVEYLKNGQTRTTIASGPMREVVENSTSKMAEADLKAMAVYLKERGGRAPRRQRPFRHRILGCRSARPSSSIPVRPVIPAPGPVSSTFPRLADNAVVKRRFRPHSCRAMVECRLPARPDRAAVAGLHSSGPDYRDVSGAETDAVLAVCLHRLLSGMDRVLAP